MTLRRDLPSPTIVDWRAVRDRIGRLFEPLAHGTTHIWAIALAKPDAAAEDQLSAPERLRAARILDPVARDRYIASHIVLRDLLGRYCAQPPPELAIQCAPGGKPYLRDHRKLHFNLSRSASWALIGVGSTGELGVDIEYRQDIDGLDKLIARHLGVRERQALVDADRTRRLSLFYDIWTRKEAWLKYTGRGLSIPLNQVEVPVQDASNLTWRRQSERFFMPAPVPSAYSASVACGVMPVTTVYFEFDAFADYSAQSRNAGIPQQIGSAQRDFV